MKPYTITIASPAAAALLQQFVEALPKDSADWPTEMAQHCAKYSVTHPQLSEITAHRVLLARISRIFAASVELGVDITIDDNEGYMEDYKEVSKALAHDLSVAHLKESRGDIMRMMGHDAEDFEDFRQKALTDPDCPKEVRAILADLGDVPVPEGAKLSDALLDDLASEGKTVIQFPKGRKDN